MEIKGKKVLVVGLGKSGLAAALFLRRQGAQGGDNVVKWGFEFSRRFPGLRM